MSVSRDNRRRLPDDQPADQGHADHPRLGRFRDPGARRAAEPAVRLRGGAAAAVVSGGRRGGHRTACRRFRSSSRSMPRRRRHRRRSEREPGFSYVPIDPCQGVIAALRTARGERIAREFIDLETPRFEPVTGSFPGPLCAQAGQPRAVRGGAFWRPSRPRARVRTPTRIAWMAARLRELESRYRSILFVCSILDWPWIRDAYQRRSPPPEPESFFAPIATFAVDPRTLIFVLGELPYHHRPVRARPPRADARRQPLGRRRQGDGARCARAAEGEASQDRPADHAAVAFDLLSLRPQPVAARPAADARPVHADRRGPADGRRRLRAGAGRDGPILPLHSPEIDADRVVRLR